MIQETAATTILVVEDDPSILALIGETLKEDYTVLAFQDAETAMEAIQQQVPDLILLDILLPGMDGVAMCRYLREDPLNADVPIIMLTARTGVDDRVDGLGAGADDYLTKPFYPQELLARVASHLRRRRRERYLNALTQLPGRREIERAIQTKLRQNTAFVYCSVDIDTFRAYNDRYGFTAGDRALQALAEILCTEVYTGAVPTDIVGHLGGDDFVFLVEQGRAVSVCEALVARFDQLVPQLYTPDDYRRGTVRVLNRRNVWDEFPLMRLLIAAVPVRAGSPPAQAMAAWLSQTAGEIKGYLKTQPGSRYLVDRRGYKIWAG